MSPLTLVYLAAGWVLGILTARHMPQPWWSWALLVPPALLGLLAARQWRRVQMVFACTLLFAAGAARMAAATPHFDADDLASYNGQGFVTVRGVIISAPDVRDTHVNLRVRTESLQIDGGWQPVGGVVLVQAPRIDTYRYGDPVQVRGDLNTPPEFDTFSYRDYLARQHVYSIMSFATVDVIAPRQGNPIRAALFDFRQRLHRIVRTQLPNPQAALLAGILLGIESGISPDVREAFNAVSATHVIAISGANLIILAGLISALARRVIQHRLGVTMITGTAIIIYAIFVGGDAAVIRAAIMALLALTAQQIGRSTYGPVSLAFAVIVMTAINPLTLWDVGFQLSVMATLGLVLYVDPLQQFIERGLTHITTTERAQAIVAGISDAFVVTIAAQITTFPIMVTTFERVSVVALPVNLLIIPAQTPLMVLGGLGVLLSLIAPPLGQLLAWGSWLFLTWTIRIVEMFARLPFASREIQRMPGGIALAVYIVLIGGTLFAMQTEDIKSQVTSWLRRALNVKLVGAAGMLAALLLASAHFALPDGRLHVTFIDVGDGMATLIQTPTGRQILVDAGGSGRKLSTGLGRALPFWDRQIDLLVISQPTERHLAGIPTIADRYHFDAIVTNGNPGDTQSAQAAWEAINTPETRRITAQPGTTVSVEDNVTLTVLHAPLNPATDTNIAADPLVLMLTYDNFRLLLPDDLTTEMETALLQSDIVLDATVLHVPRSGHETVNSPAFLAAVDPQAAVINVDAGNRYDLPHDEVLNRLLELDILLYRTDQMGTVEIISDGAQLWIRTRQR